MEVKVILQRVKVTRRASKEVLTQDYNVIVVPISEYSFYQRQSQQHSTNGLGITKVSMFQFINNNNNSDKGGFICRDWCISGLLQVNGEIALRVVRSIVYCYGIHIRTCTDSLQLGVSWLGISLLWDIPVCQPGSGSVGILVLPSTAPSYTNPSLRHWMDERSQ